MKFSIILPVYNSEKFINQTIQSVINQNFNDYELIIINDGSNDESYDIISKYDNIKNIKIFNNKNKGVSYSRNYGIKMSVGEYLLFLDSDDQLTKNALESYNEIILNNDYNLIITSYISIGDNKNIEFNVKETINKCNNKYYDLVKYNSEFLKVVWGKLFKSEIIKNNKIKFNENLIINEDGDWLLEVIENVKDVVYKDVITYIYRNNNIESITKKRETIKMFMSSYYVYNKWIMHYKKLNNSIMQNYMEEGLYRLFSYVYDIEKSDKKIAVKVFEKNIEKIKNIKKPTYRYLYKILRNKYLFLISINVIRKVKLKLKNIL